PEDVPTERAAPGSSVWTWTLSAERSPTTRSESPSGSSRLSRVATSSSSPSTTKIVQYRYRESSRWMASSARLTVSCGTSGSGSAQLLREHCAVLGRRLLERVDDAPHGEHEIRSSVPVRDRIDVQVVDSPAMRLEVLQGRFREGVDGLPVHRASLIAAGPIAPVSRSAAPTHTPVGRGARRTARPSWPHSSRTRRSRSTHG